MKARSIILSSLILAVSWIAPASAAPDPEGAIPADPALSQGAVGARISGLNAGKPSRLALLASWVAPKSDRHASEFAYGPAEDLEVVIHTAFTQGNKAKDVIWTVSIQDESGAEIFSDELRQNSPSANHYFWAPDVGPFPIGHYLVKIKVKQGKKKVGMKYWFRIL